jgi:opacity protein-like surface antigen
MRRLTLALAVVLTVLAVASEASAQWFLDAYLGPALTSDSKLEFTAFNEQQRQNVIGRSSPSFGVRVGRWLDDLQIPFVGVAFDVSYFRPAADVQTVPLSLLLMARYGFLKDDEVPDGRLQPYVGIGPGFFISNLNGIIGSQSGDSTSRDIGLDTRVGLAYRFDSNWAGFAEYRFTRVSPTWKVDIFNGTTDATTTFNTHHIVLGVSYRF